MIRIYISPEQQVPPDQIRRLATAFFEKSTFVEPGQSVDLTRKPGFPPPLFPPGKAELQVSRSPSGEISGTIKVEDTFNKVIRTVMVDHEQPVLMLTGLDGGANTIDMTKRDNNGNYQETIPLSGFIYYIHD